MSARSPRALRAIKLLLWTSYALVWTGGVMGHLLYGGTPANMRWAAPLFLILASLLAVAAAFDDIRALAISFIAGFLVEALGVATGWPFGHYSYTATLAPALLGVPLVMAGAWMILIGAVRQLRLPFWAGALVMVAIDGGLDPAAVHIVHFWTWRHPGFYFGVPLSNFAGWYAASALILWILRATPRANVELIALGASVVLFFVFISAAHGYWVPVLVGVSLCLVGYLGWSSSRRSAMI